MGPGVRRRRRDAGLDNFGWSFGADCLRSGFWVGGGLGSQAAAAGRRAETLVGWEHAAAYRRAQSSGDRMGQKLGTRPKVVLHWSTGGARF